MRPIAGDLNADLDAHDFSDILNHLKVRSFKIPAKQILATRCTVGDCRKDSIDMIVYPDPVSGE
jgi:hypothetical protein